MSVLGDIDDPKLQFERMKDSAKLQPTTNIIIPKLINFNCQE